MHLISCVLALLLSSYDVAGHGYLAVPGARNSMWRLGFDTPKNYNDMGLNCGGMTNQWNNHGGKCGLCGDPYQSGQPRQHEAGGRFAPVDRPISRCYNKVDNVIDVSVRITSHHKGYMEFRLCVNNNMALDPSADCIDNGRLLTIAGTQETKFDINNDYRDYYNYQLELPNDVTCTQCILHWKYNAGNNNGCDETGCGLGLGPQEQFHNCADIAILPDCEAEYTTVQPTTRPTNAPSTTTRRTPTTTSSTEEPATTTRQPEVTTTEEPEVTTEKPEVTTVEPDESTEEPDGDATRCWAVGVWSGQPGYDQWCMNNCFHDPPFCPESHCECDD